MGGSVNRVFLIGHLGADPEVKYLPSGQAVCEMRLATSETFKDKQGEKQERTEWHRIVVWGKTAENCAQYLAKGRQIYVEGRLQTRSWDDKDGNKRYTTEIVANDVRFLGSGGGEGRGERGGGDAQPRGEGRSEGRGQQRRAPAPQGSGMGDGPPDFPGGGSDDDIPF